MALLLQGVGDLLPTNSANALFEILANASPISKAVLLILALYSIGSWGVILHKWWTFRRTRRQTASFLEVFRRSSKFSEVQAVCASLKDSPLVGLFQAPSQGINQHLLGKTLRKGTRVGFQDRP